VPQLRIALAQVNPTVGDIGGNIDLVARAVETAAADGAHLVVLPEMVVTGYPVEDLALRSSFVDASRTATTGLAGRLDAAGLGSIVAIVGYLDRDGAATDRLGRPKGSPQNAAAVITGGRVVARYAKHHLPNYGVFDEFRYFVPGNDALVVRAHGVDVAVSICEDIWQDGPSLAARAAGAGLMVVINGSPYEAEKDDVRAELCRCRAEEAGCPVAYVNMVGGQDELVFDGDSLVVSETGEVVARSPQFVEDLLVVDLDLAAATSDDTPTCGDLTVRRVDLGTPVVERYEPRPAPDVDRLEDEAGDRRGEFIEIVAHHAERSFALSAELRLGRDLLVPRAARAGAVAVAMAERAELRGEPALMERFLAIAERAAATAEDTGLRDRTAYLRVRALIVAGRWDEGRPAAIAALAAARNTGDAGRAASIARTLAVAEMWGGALDDIMPALITARELSVAADDAAGVIEVDALRLEFHWGAGDFSALIEGGVPLIETALAMGNATQAAQIMMRVAGAARLSGRLDLAAHYIAEARAIGRRFGLRALLRDVRSSEATAAWFTGDSGAALEILEEVRAEAVGDGDGNRLVGTARRRSDILEGDGRYAEAVTAGTSALAESIRTGERWNRSEIEGHLAVNLLRVGRTAEAEAHMADAAALVRGAGDVSGTAEAEWARAHFLAAGGDHDAADAAFRDAIATVDPREFAPLKAFFRLERAEFLLARKRIAEAAALLAEVERIAPPPPWNYLPDRRRALAAALAAQRVS